jgi:1,2-diacylglycerol 3-beta-galactosyltransferase
MDRFEILSDPGNQGASDKRVLILTADVGFGHRSAARAIAAALEEQYKQRCKVEIANPLDDERTPALLRDSQTDYDRLVRENPEIYKLQYQVSDSTLPSTIIEQAVTLLLYRVLQDIVSRAQPDVVVATHPLYPAPLGTVIALGKRNIPYFTVVTDMGAVHRLWFNATADMTMVPTQIVREIALQYNLPPEKVITTGIPVSPRIALEDRSKEQIRAEKGWRTDLVTVLVAGSKRVKNLDSVLNVLNHSGLPVQFVVTAGGDQELFARLKDTVWHHPTFLYEMVHEMPAFLKAADLIICKAGGLMVTESLASGLPLLLVDVTPGQEEGNARYVVENGAGELAQSPVMALETLFHWLENKRVLLEQRANMSRLLGKPMAAFTIAELAWSAAERGPLPIPESRRALLPRLREWIRQSGVAMGISDETT